MAEEISIDRRTLNKTFTDVDTLDAAVHTAVVDLNTERNRDLLGKQRISA